MVIEGDAVEVNDNSERATQSLQRSDSPRRTSSLLLQPLQSQTSDHGTVAREPLGNCGSDDLEKLSSPLLEEHQEEKPVILTKEMEEEILGPESYTWCGLGCLKGGRLQKLARPEIYLLIFSMAGLSQGVFFVYSNSTLSTVERRFRLPSAISGLITSGNDVLQIFLSLHLGFIAGNGHRPHWLAAGMLLSGIGCFIVVIPHIIFGAGDFSNLSQDMASSSNDSQSTRSAWMWCGSDRDPDDDYCLKKASEMGVEQYTVATLMFIGQLFSGASGAFFYIVGYSYLDDSVSKDKVPLYFAIAGCMRIFGPVTGYALSSWTLRQWLEVGVQPPIKPTHPQWVGAWWIGYLLIMAMLTLTASWLVLLPRTLPGTRERTLVRLRAAAAQGTSSFIAYKDSLRPIKRPSLKKMWPALKRLAHNRLFMAIAISQTFYWLVLAGFFNFQPKYLEKQFKMAAAEASQYMALAGIVASLAGWLGAGSLLTCLKPPPKVTLWITMAVSLASVAAYIGQMTITCEPDKVLGLEEVMAMGQNAKQGNPSGSQHLQEEKSYLPAFSQYSSNAEVLECMSGCGCEGSKFLPVCVEDQHTFFSPCHAGCSSFRLQNSTKMYQDCACAHILQSLAMKKEEAFDLNVKTNRKNLEGMRDGSDNTKRWTEINTSTNGGNLQEMEDLLVVDGSCRKPCDNFWKYMVLSVCSSFLMSANRGIANIIFFRSVDQRDKDLSLGVLNVVLSLAFAVCPILIGYGVDMCCKLWQWTCGQKGFCHIYDLDAYRWLLHIPPAVGIFLSFILECFLLKWHRDLDFFGEKELKELGLLDPNQIKKKKKVMSY